MSRIDGPRMPPARAGKPAKLVILAHGYGSNGDDLMALAPYLSQALPDAMFVAPHGPEPVPGYPDGRQWFPITRMDPAALARGVADAAPAFDRFLDQELQRYQLPASALALVGFSQGTMMALHVGLRRRERIGAIIGFSGALAVPPAGRVASPPSVALIHGDQDEMIPVEALFATATTLADRGVPSIWKVSPGLGHAISEDGLALAAAVLKAGLSGALADWKAPAPKSHHES